MSNSKDVRGWYNNFSKNQTETGLNIRHYKIMNELIKSGLRKDSVVLEVGCGVGTLTVLLNKFLSKGKLVATDISDESIEKAKKRIPNSSKIDFFVTDMKDFSYLQKFDFIVLPDVLEHIPIDQHKELFSCFEENMNEKSMIFIHVPHPRMIENVRKLNPERLQIIDQSIEADRLLSDACANHLTLVSYEPYALFQDKNDYVVIKFIKNNFVNYSPISKFSIIYKKTIERIKFILS